jgi:membrane protein DedA with SNARE-associated domain
LLHQDWRIRRYGSCIGLTETRIRIAQYLFRRQGTVVVLIARFVAVVRSVIGFIAGANRMPFAKFMIANSAGAVAWALFYGLGAYYLGKGVEEFARPFALALAAIGAIVVISMIMYWRRKEQAAESGHHEKAAHHAHTARAHALHARNHSEEAAKVHGEEHGKK